MNHAIEFVETSMCKELATDDELKDLRVELIAQPDKGDMMKDTGGLRKVRMAVDNQGKSGSVRELYVLTHADKIFLVMAYPKSVKDSLTKEDKTTPKKFVQSLKGKGK